MTTYSSIQNSKSLSASRNLLWNPAQQDNPLLTNDFVNTSSGGSTPEVDNAFFFPGWNCSSKNYGQFGISSMSNSGYNNIRPHQFENHSTPTISADSHLTYHTGFTFEDIKNQDPNFGTALASPMTFSFWVKSNVVGAFILELTTNEYMVHNNQTGQITQTRDACSLPYTINVANTWEFKILNFPAYTTSFESMFEGGYMSANFWLVSGTDYKSGGNLNSSGWTNIYDQSGNYPPLPNNNRAVGLTTDFATNTVVSDPNQPWLTNAYWRICMPQLECSAVATPFSVAPNKTTEKCKNSLFQTSSRQPLPGGVMGDYSNSSRAYLVHPKFMGMMDMGFAQTKSFNHFDKDKSIIGNSGGGGARIYYEAQNGATSSTNININYMSHDQIRIDSSAHLPGLHRGAMLACYATCLRANSMKFFNLNG